MASPKSATKLTVHRGFDWPGRYTWSPFVTKLEVRLRFAGLPYAVGAGGPRSAPQGKIPYVDIPGEDQQMGDSTFIIRRLVEKDMLPDLNARLSKPEQAQDLAWRALMEDKLYFYGVSIPGFPRPPFPHSSGLEGVLHRHKERKKADHASTPEIAPRALAR